MSRRRAAAREPETIAFLGDLHAGSHWGLHPTGEDWLSLSSKWSGVRYLMECYEHLLETWPQRIDILCLTGDLIDGPQAKSRSTGLFTAKLSEQVELAIEILRPLVARAGVVLRVDGTPYHEEFHGALRELDREFHVTKTAQVIDLDLGPGILNVAHHPMGGSMLYKGTSVDREQLWATIAAARRKVPSARWIVRAHQHEYINQETQDCQVVSLPCFQLATPHAKKQAYWRWQPTLGAVLMRRDPDHRLGYRFDAELYDPPQPTVTSAKGLLRGRA